MFTGSVITTLQGYDPDGDALTFDLYGAESRDLLSVEAISPSEAQLILKKLLDREVCG